MKKNTNDMLDGWIEKYNEKCPFDPFVRDEQYKLLTDEEKGFCEIRFTDDAVWVGQLCGNMVYWLSLAKEKAIEKGLRYLCVSAIRTSMDGYFRLIDHKILEKTPHLKDGAYHYVTVNEATGTRGEADPGWQYEDGHYAYFVTFDFGERE